MNPKEEIERIKAERKAKGGRPSKAETERIKELEAMSDENAELEGAEATTSQEPIEEPVASTEDAAPIDPRYDFSGALKTIMVKHHNLGLPTPSGKVQKVVRFDVAEVPAAFAEDVCARDLAQETKDDPTVELE